MKIPISNYFKREYNSLSFYRDIPTKKTFIFDDLQLDFSKFDWSQSSLDIQDVDLLTYIILREGVKLLPERSEDLLKFSRMCSKKYFEIIQSGIDNIKLKLKCQRLNYLIQNLICWETVPTNESKLFLDEEFFYPWDLISFDELLCILESQDTVKINNKIEDCLSGKGFMLTQVDVYSSKVVFNSCYSSYVIESDIKLERFTIRNESSHLFKFFYLNQAYYIGCDFCLYRNKECILKIEMLNKPWRFRLKDNYLFIFDWYKFGSFLVINLTELESVRLSLPEMFIPHDVEKVAKNFYFLDKQQGNLFVYDDKFNYKYKQMGFGFEVHKLCDPIGIKKHSENSLLISSWLSGKVVKVSLSEVQD